MPFRFPTHAQAGALAGLLVYICVGALVIAASLVMLSGQAKKPTEHRRSGVIVLAVALACLGAIMSFGIGYDALTRRTTGMRG